MRSAIRVKPVDCKIFYGDSIRRRLYVGSCSICMGHSLHVERASRLIYVLAISNAKRGYHVSSIHHAPVSAPSHLLIISKEDWLSILGQPSIATDLESLGHGIDSLDLGIGQIPAIQLPVLLDALGID